MNDFNENTKKYEELITKVIKEKPEFSHLANTNIKCIASEKKKISKGKETYATTEKVNDKYQFLTGFDFIITFYPIADRLPLDKLEILIIHELMHIGFDPTTESRWIEPHDVEDFAKLINQYGVYWTR